MTKGLGLAAGIIVLAGGLIVGSTVLLGNTIRDRMEASAAQMTVDLPALRVVSRSYEKGVFQSTQTLTLEPACASAAGAASASVGRSQLMVRHQIQHGPFPGFRGVGAAVVDSDVSVSPDLRQRMIEVFGESAPLSARTRVGFDGGWTSRIEVPAFQYQGVTGDRIASKGLRANIDANGWGLGARMRLDLTVPDLSVSRKDETGSVEVKLDGWTARSDAVIGRSVWLSSGHGSSDIARVAVAMQGQGERTAIAPVRMTLVGLKATTDSSLERDLLGNTTRLTAAGTVNDAKLDRIEMQTSLRRLHAPTYEALLKAALSPETLCADKKSAPPSIAELQASMAALLPHDPEYALDKLLIDIDGQRAEMSYVMGVEGITEADLKRPMQAALMAKGHASGQIKLPTAWLREVAASMGNTTGAPAPPAEMVDVLIDDMTTKGLLVREGDAVSSKFTFDKGRLTVNGKPMGAPPGAR